MEGGGGGLKERRQKTVWAYSAVCISCTGNTPYINSILLRNVNKPVCVGHSILLSLYSLLIRTVQTIFHIYVFTKKYIAKTHF
jgi:hypothetical protein